MAADSPDKQTILIIDDNEVVLEVSKNALESAGYRVVTHSRAAGSVALLLQEKPDLVLIELNMPTTSGDTLAAMFDKARPGRGTVILLHSSLSPELLQAKVTAAGAHGYLQKSGDLYNLVRTINRWLKATASSGRQRAAAPAADDPGNYSSGSLRVARLVAPDSVAGNEPGSSPSSGLGVVMVPTVLFVANDISVLSDYRRVVQSLDLRAEFALSGAQALRKVRAEATLDVVACNANLSDMSGIELRQRLVELDPSWRRRVLLIAPHGASLPSGLAAIREPVSERAMSDAIREAVSHLPRSQRNSG